MIVSCALPPSSASPEIAALAEGLGYERVWFYDSPAFYGDVWAALARSADRTTTVGLGAAALIPSLRHPMVNAAAIAGMAELAPGRLAVAIGSGFTGRVAMGRRPIAWAEVAAYVRVLRALLAGEDAEWDGATLRMLHPSGFGPVRPIRVPILIGADGPKGLAVAAEVGDGVFSAGFPQPDAERVAPWRALLAFGTVFDEGEDFSTPRVLDTLAPAGAVLYHALYERRGDAVDALEGGARWRQAMEAEPPARRHLAVHAGHLVEASPLERELAPGLGPMLAASSLSGPPEQIRHKLGEMAAVGVTEVAFQPMGDVERELEAMAAAALGPEGR